jgi:hypothetical protein
MERSVSTATPFASAYPPPGEVPRGAPCDSPPHLQHTSSEEEVRAKITECRDALAREKKRNTPSGQSAAGPSTSQAGFRLRGL